MNDAAMYFGEQFHTGGLIQFVDGLPDPNTNNYCRLPKTRFKGTESAEIVWEEYKSETVVFPKGVLSDHANELHYWKKVM